jgi:hypothetical protein
MVGDKGGLQLDSKPENAVDMNFACGMYCFTKEF